MSRLRARVKSAVTRLLDGRQSSAVGSANKPKTVAAESLQPAAAQDVQAGRQSPKAAEKAGVPVAAKTDSTPKRKAPPQSGKRAAATRKEAPEAAKATPAKVTKATKATKATPAKSVKSVKPATGASVKPEKTAAGKAKDKKETAAPKEKAGAPKTEKQTSEARKITTKTTTTTSKKSSTAAAGKVTLKAASAKAGTLKPSARPKTAAPKSAAPRKAATAQKKSASPARTTRAKATSSAKSPVTAGAASFEAVKSLTPEQPAAKSSRNSALAASLEVDARRGLPHKEPRVRANLFELFFDEQGSPYHTPPASRRDILPVAVEWKERMRPGELFLAFKRFFEANELGNRLVPTLREGAGAIIEFEGDPQSYHLYKERGEAVLASGRMAGLDLEVRMTRYAVESLVTQVGAEAGEHVDRIIELMRERAIELRTLSGEMELLRKGYLGVVAAGGRRLAELLSESGFPVPAAFLRLLSDR